MSAFADFLQSKGWQTGPLPALWLKRHARDPQSPEAIDDMVALGLRTADGRPLSPADQARVKHESSAWPVAYLAQCMKAITDASGLDDLEGPAPGP